MPRALVLVHLEHEGVGSLGQWLPAAGLELDELRLHAGDEVPDGLAPSYGALVVMGGAMGVADADRLPWLRSEMDLIRRTTESGTPILGVCLGAQLLAAANGGRVEEGAAGPEIGAATIGLTEAAASDPLLRDVPTPAPVVQWHWDAVVELPPGATRLASSATYPNQAFRVGDRAWGLQFHVETTADMVAGWARNDSERLAAQGFDASVAGSGAAGITDRLAETWRPVAERFAAVALKRS